MAAKFLDRLSKRTPNNSVRKTTTIVAGLLAAAGFEHGLFEALQGSKFTHGVFIQAIGDSMKWWKYGTEDAFTVVPNFLLTGILAMSVSTSIVIWSLFFLHRADAAKVLLLLFIALTAVGGGVGFIPFFLVTWAYATRTGSSLEWWRGRLSSGARRKFSTMWTPALVGAAACWLVALETAIWGYLPGNFGPEATLNICWSFLLFAMLFINLTFVSAIARDIEMKRLAVEGETIEPGVEMAAGE
jgi:hypothetical protein